jgi:antirestriction protein ArdC
MAQAAGYRTSRFLTYKQALELGGNVRKGEHGTKVYFVKQLQVRDKGADDNSSTRLIQMMREYTVFNVDPCENPPDSVITGKPMRVRNPDSRDEQAGACSTLCHRWTPIWWVMEKIDSLYVRKATQHATANFKLGDWRLN